MLYAVGMKKIWDFWGKSGQRKSLSEGLVRLLLVGRPVGCAIRGIAHRPGLSPSLPAGDMVPGMAPESPENGLDRPVAD